jgi:hypothetical protein
MECLLCGHHKVQGHGQTSKGNVSMNALNIRRHLWILLTRFTIIDT